MQGLVWPGAETPYQVFTYTYIHTYIYILVMNARPCVARS